MAMDAEWALTELRQFERMTVMRNNSGGTMITYRSSTAASDAEVTRVAPVIEKILDRVIPDWRTSIELHKSNRWTRHREATMRAITILERQAELRAKLGDNAPNLDASRLHPWAWDGARSLWQSRHYREAVEAALKKVSAEAQNKTGRHDITETNLFKQLFTTDEAKPGKPRLRLMADDDSDTYRSIHRGAASLTEGLFAGIRNVVAHTVAEIEADEQRALEQLAAVSVLARWVHEAEVVIAP